MKTNIQKFVLAALVFAFFSCKKNEGKVEIHLISKQINSLDEENNLRDYTPEEKKKAKNMLTFKLINKTDQIQLLLLDPYYMLVGNLEIQIKDTTGKQHEIHPSIIDYVLTEEYMSHAECVMHQYEQILKKYEGRGIKNIAAYQEYNEHSVVLYPGEERTFKAIVYLPLLSADNGSFAGGNLSFKKLNAGDSLRLAYKADTEKYKKALPDWELKELKKRNINFYADTIYSGYIPLRIVK